MQDTFKIISEIIDDHAIHSIKEVNASLQLLFDIEGSNFNKNDKFQTVENVIKETKNQDIIEGAVFTLGNVKDYKAVQTVINNREVVNDDSLITYFVDKNYIVIEEMLNMSNNIETIRTALDCVEIAPYQEFLNAINKLAIDHKDEDIRNKAKLLTEVLEVSELQRNSKWDYNR